jgi:uncharacterized protein YcfJ
MPALMARRLAVALACFSLGVPAVAQTTYHHHHYRHHYRSCAAARRNRTTTGTVVGAVGGGVLGSALSHGSVGGVHLGAGAGAYTGHEVARNTARC